MHRLYHLPLSPFCRKVRLVLAEKRVEAELIEERPWDRRLDFLRMNPAGKVPVFVTTEGRVLAESAAICDYLEAIMTEPELMPRDAVQRAEVLRLIGWFDDKFYREVTENLLFERVTKRLARLGYPDGACLKAGSQNIRIHLDYMTYLLEGHNWIAGPRMTLADITAAAHLSCLDYCGDVPWEDYPVVRDWYAVMKSRPGFRGLLADHLPGMKPPPHYADLDF
ncbi:glutathione S-transferase family protein [Limibaculum sp. M0105]|uniref:Glutathione S-transferase family protein n=1 Tax=Thermohalobaculum xanthum TaxID=2753746 RepID=A0A8J7M9E3_9RHOB|nr:glutathione S-transferase family protein [Thermohalobaculum xanthum]MBK0400568.1 glutathione S-transferase family protein [Thermohalobaculum xanthum]